MSVWGKFGGGGLGLAVGGPIGGLLGALAGHLLIDREGAPFGPPPRDVILTTGLIALAAKMAKADGVVLQAEIDAFESIVIVPPDQHGKVAMLFQLAAETTAGFEAYAGQLARAFADEPLLLEDVVEALLLIAKADGAVHEAELEYLADVAARLGRTPEWFASVVELHLGRADDPYLALGAERSWTAERLKAHHRALVREHHPDREIARGLPEEAIAVATARLAAINAAWDRIARERGL